MREHVLWGAVGSHLVIMRIAGFKDKAAIAEDRERWKDGKNQSP